VGIENSARIHMVKLDVSILTLFLYPFVSISEETCIVFNRWYTLFISSVETHINIIILFSIYWQICERYNDVNLNFYSISWLKWVQERSVSSIDYSKYPCLHKWTRMIKNRVYGSCLFNSQKDQRYFLLNIQSSTLINCDIVRIFPSCYLDDNTTTVIFNGLKRRG